MTWPRKYWENVLKIVKNNRNSIVVCFHPDWSNKKNQRVRCQNRKLIGSRKLDPKSMFLSVFKNFKKNRIKSVGFGIRIKFELKFPYFVAECRIKCRHLGRLYNFEFDLPESHQGLICFRRLLDVLTYNWSI